jgi:mono-ADP-ribosyltransferase sirtuin 6
MTNNAPKVAAEIREPVTAVDNRAEALAAQIKNSKHFVVFIGAGVSTSAGVQPRTSTVLL